MPFAVSGIRIAGQAGVVTLLIKEGRIEEILPGNQVPDGYEALDSEGLFAIPGLIDLASRCQDLDCLRLNLRYGVTTLRLVGGLEAARKPSEEKLPRLVRGATLDMKSNPPRCDYRVSAKENLESVVEDAWSRGAEWLFLEPAVPEEVAAAIVPIAHARGLKVAARVGALKFEQALAIPFDSLEHLSSPLTSMIQLSPFAYQKSPESLFRKYVVPQLWSVGLEGLLDGEGFPQLAESRVPLVPGLSMIEYPPLRKPPDLDRLPGSLAKPLSRYGLSRTILIKGQKLVLELMKSFHKSGVPIAVGSWSPGPLNVPGFSVHREMELLVQAGWTPAEALKCATENGARTLGLEKTGRIEKGYAADLLLLSEDPTKEIKGSQTIQKIILGGELVDLSLLAGKGEANQILGIPWTSPTLDDFSDLNLVARNEREWEPYSKDASQEPKARLIKTDFGGYLRLSGRSSRGSETGIRLSLVSDKGSPRSMASFSGIHLRVRGNRKQFWLRLPTASVTDEDYFQATFVPGEDWTEIQIPWTSLRQSGQGRPLQFSGRDIQGIEIYTRSRLKTEIFQIDLDLVGLYE